MIKQKQLFRHKPEEGQIGDCHRTALACLFDLPVESVPHFAANAWDYEKGAFKKDNGFTDDVTQWLDSKGFVEVSIPVIADSPELALRFNTYNKAYGLLGGKSNTGVNHTVIIFANDIVWDPALNNSGIIGPCDDGHYWFSWLVPLDLSKVRMEEKA